MLVENFKNKYGLMLPIQAVATELGIPKKAVEELIDTGVLQSVETMGKKYVSAFNLANMLGESAIDSGQLASGYPAESALYLSHNLESEDSSMKYKGNISTLKDGRFMVQINLGKKPDGSRHRESKGFTDKVSAERYLTQRLAQLNGIPIQQQPIFVSADTVQNTNYTEKTFEQYSRDILNRGIGKAGARTIEGYRASLVPVLPYIGSIRMTEIDKDRLISMFNKLSYKYGKSTLNKAFNTTKMLFEEALDNEEIAKTPFTRLKVPKSKVVKVNDRLPYGDEDISVLFDKAKGYQNKMVYPILAVLECTGMRPAELRALEWKNFDIENNTIHIYQAVVTEFEEITDMKKRPKSFEVIGPTKSIYGVRKLHLSNVAVQALIDWRKTLDTMSLAEKESKYIFPSKKGDFRTESSIKCIMQRFVKKVDIGDMDFMLYRFRHTVCTRLILEGISVPIIQRIMGDNTPDVILKIYNHITQEQALGICDSYYDKINQKYSELYKNYL